jgi:hypothetical protein
MMDNAMCYDYYCDLNAKLLSIREEAEWSASESKHFSHYFQYGEEINESISVLIVDDNLKNK